MVVNTTGDWQRALRQAHVNANASGVPWVVYLCEGTVRYERADEQDMSGQPSKARRGGQVVNPDVDVWRLIRHPKH